MRTAHRAAHELRLLRGSTNSTNPIYPPLRQARTQAPGPRAPPKGTAPGTDSLASGPRTGWQLHCAASPCRREASTMGIEMPEKAECHRRMSPRPGRGGPAQVAWSLPMTTRIPRLLRGVMGRRC
jgi:hypothetical protein